MSDDRPSDALGHFSAEVERFHSHYTDRAEFLERLEIWHGLLDEHFVPGGLAIDMGCGTGVFTFYLAKKPGRVVGVDGSAEMVKFCEAQRKELRLDNVRFVEGKLPNIDETGLAGADLVISSSVVEYVEDLDGALALFVRLLKPGGKLILSMPNLMCINRIYERLKYRWKNEPPIYQYIRHFTTPSLLRLRMRRHPLALDRVHYYAHYTRLAKLTRKLRLPGILTEDLFVAVFRKRG